MKTASALLKEQGLATRLRFEALSLVRMSVTEERHDAGGDGVSDDQVRMLLATWVRDEGMWHAAVSGQYPEPSRFCAEIATEVSESKKPPEVQVTNARDASDVLLLGIAHVTGAQSMEVTPAFKYDDGSFGKGKQGWFAKAFFVDLESSSVFVDDEGYITAAISSAPLGVPGVMSAAPLPTQEQMAKIRQELISDGFKVPEAKEMLASEECMWRILTLLTLTQEDIELASLDGDAS